jgi:hypothetical protein
MPSYRVDVDEVVKADSPAELVDYLWRTAKITTDTKAGYRVRSARYARAIYNASIRTVSDEAFVEDMLRAGIYTEEVVH